MKLFITLASVLLFSAPAAATLTETPSLPIGHSCIAGIVETGPGMYRVDWLDHFGLQSVEGVTQEGLDFLKFVEEEIGKPLAC